MPLVAARRGQSALIARRARRRTPRSFRVELRLPRARPDRVRTVSKDLFPRPPWRTASRVPSIVVLARVVLRREGHIGFKWLMIGPLLVLVLVLILLVLVLLDEHVASARKPSIRTLGHLH